MPSGRQMIPPKQERSEESTRRLLDAAVELVAEAGYAGMTLAATGDRAGYSRGLVTTRFGNKENLLRALIDRLGERWWPFFEHPPAQADGLHELLALVRAVGEGVASDPVAHRALQRLIFERAVGPVDELQQQFALSATAIVADVARIVERGREDGSIRADADPVRVAALVIAVPAGHQLPVVPPPGHGRHGGHARRPRRPPRPRPGRNCARRLSGPQLARRLGGPGQPKAMPSVEADGAGSG